MDESFIPMPVPAAVAELVRQIWEKALGAAPGPGADFFACGGDSLAALAVSTEVAQATRLVVPLDWLYAHPCLDDAVAALVSAPAAGRTPVSVQPRSGEHPLSFQQEGLLRVIGHVGGAHRYQGAYAVILPSSVDTGRLRDAVGALDSRHPMLSARIVQGHDGSAQVASGTGPVLQQTAVSAQLAAQAVDDWAADAISLDGPLVRMGLIGPADERRLVLAAHQMVMDPWSWGLLLRDIAALYADAGVGGGPRLAYTDYSRWQREHLVGPRFEEHLRFWRQLVAEYRAEGVPLPVMPQPLPAAGPAARLPVEVPGPVAEALRAVAKSVEASVFEVLLALFHLAVGRWAGVDDVLVGSATANRTLPGLEEVVGFFVNGRFTRSRLDEATSAFELVEQVRAAWRSVDAHRELHLEKTLFDLGVPDAVNVKFSLNTIPTLTDLPYVEGVRLRAAPVAPVPSARRHVSVGLSPAGRGLAGALTYRTDLLQKNEASALIEGFGQVLQNAAADPAARIRLAD
ncbi:condensation domain-containing protein [Streptomyces luteireticuli]|uniref:condensation domain-containing protein n=1 Tax=Streptomyces luteireticuli TaxID=173858 RepID=UPI003558DB81